MIYKNLPAPTLHRVLFARMILDLVAMLVYLLRLRPGQAASVLKGWRCFLIKRQRYESTRQENLKKTVLPISPELMKPYSLLFQYYFKGRKRYSDLP